jgi:hypothetical protein
MKVGIVYEDFHSEVLEFILEMLQFELDTNIIVYNDKDRYSNIDVYQQKYNRIQRRSLGTFIRDLNNEVCDKYIVISYTNLFNVGLFQEFKDKLIFIGHDDSQVKQLKSAGMNYIVLSKLLSDQLQEEWKYMLPICKNSKIENNYTDLKPVETEEQIGKRKAFIEENGLKTILIVGHFLENNKDLELIKNVLSTKGIFLFVFAPALTKELSDISKVYSKYMVCGVNFSTKLIEKFIEEYNINYLLFAPPKESSFFKSQWSGSIAFGLNRNMTVIMPKELAKEYLIEDAVLTYENSNDTIIENLVKKDTTETRNKIYKRNCIVMEMLLYGKYKEYKYKNGYFIKNEEHIGLDNTEQIIEEIPNNANIYIISPETAKTAIDIMKTKKNCNILLFNKDLSKCLEYKSTMVLYNYEDRVKIYNEELVEKVTLDVFDNKVHTIIKEGDNINEIQIAKRTLKKYSPKIVLINNKDNLKKETVEIDGYMWKKKELVNTNLDKFEVVEWISILKN